MRIGTLATTGALLLSLIGASPALAATPEPEPTPPATSTPAPTADPAAPAPTAAPSAAPTEPAAPSSPEPSPSTSTPAADPSLAVQDAAGDHAMGSTIEAVEGPAAGARTITPKASLGVGGVLGMDVSGWQPTVDWNAMWANGARFVYIKTTESTDYVSSHFPSQWAGATNVGMIRGAYHFATPNTTDGATQARYFVAHGGTWAPDGRTLPPLLDIEYATDGSGTCWGLSPAAMSQWIRDFVGTMKALTGIEPAIYSTANWWNQCTGSNNTFGAYPLFVARYGTSTPGALPASWLNWTMWQFASSGVFAGDQDIFNGNYAQLQAFAFGANSHPPVGAYDTATVTSGQPFRVTGWAFDLTNLAAAVQIQVSWSTPAGNTTTTATANLSRPDVGAAYPAAGGTHGFSITTPWAGYGQYGACITVIALPGDRAGNSSLGCKTAFISAATATAPTAQRLTGSDRFATAVAISQDRYPNAGVPVVYIASGLDYPDALAAAPAAAAQRGPVLLTTSSSVPSATLTEVNRLKPQKIVVVGGPNAVGDAAAAQLSAVAPVTRLGGGDRYETAQRIAAYAFPNATKAYVASGFGFADALSAGPVAAKLGAPLLLVGTPNLDAGTQAFLSARSIKQVTIVGGTSVVSPLWAQGAQSAGITVTRIGGSSRFETSTQITATAFGANAGQNVYIASGVNWPDALVAAAAAGSVPKPLLLSNSGCVPRTVGDQLVRLGTTSMKVVGGTDALTADVNSLGVCFVG
ncbi:cell wall-binding repeat-containing protein [Leifsonia sp. NPDC077715]|uniref:cell wall-binding repeat-containing protein n=1 Tax=Leifsonia sp. NPDC077715 TaxID=3155539 RepID=UPI003417874B